MITPVFEIHQDEENLTFKVRAPYANLRELEVEFTGNLFLFSCAPYYLRVHLPKKVREEDLGNNTSYDCDAGVFTIVVPKLNKGEVFEDLDMISELLRPQKPPTAKRLVEEIGEQGGSGDEDGIDDEEEEGENVEQYYQEQKMRDVSAGIKDEESNLYGYGFGWRRNGVLEQLRDQIGNVVDLLEPEICPLADRVVECAKFDQQKFDYGRYLVDVLQPEEELLSMIASSFQGTTELTEEDRTKLKDLPNRKVPALSADDERATVLALVDLVFAWAYDQRTNDWEMCCESGWTISRLSPTLAFLLRWNNVKEACIGAVRRSLCYPLYRSWDLAMKVLDDTAHIFRQGKSALVHVLCEIHSAMIRSSEFRYLLNDLLLTDMLLWIQATPLALTEGVAKELETIKITKEDMGLDLDTIELDAQMKMMAVDEMDSDDADEVEME